MTETLNYDKKYWEKPCPQVDCRKDSCKCGLKRVFLPASLGDDGKDSPVAPKNGAYCDALVIYEANNHVYIYSKEGIPTLMTSGDSSVEEEINKLKRSLGDEVANRIEGDTTLQNEIDDIKNSPDVVDIVATYADLQSYDTSKLGDNDVIRVLQDEEHDGQSTYYRWNKQSETWTYIGAVGDYYTKGQVDTLLSGKQNQLTAGSNVSIAQEGDDLVISATDTTYSNFVGTDGIDAGSAGLVPAPATADAGKFLKADGTWDMAGGGNTGEAKVLTTGDYNYDKGNTGTNNCVAMWLLSPGLYSNSNGVNIIVASNYSFNTNNRTYLVSKSDSTNSDEVQIICFKGKMLADRAMHTVSSSGTGINSKYFLVNTDTVDNLNSSDTVLPLSANQGKTLKDLIDGLVISGAGAPTTSTVGTVGMLYEDTTNGKIYICTAVTPQGTVPETYTYTWSEVGAGGGSGPTVVQTTGISTTDVMSQNAVSSMLFADPANADKIRIGNTGTQNLAHSISIGYGASAPYGDIVIGQGAIAYLSESVTIGKMAKTVGDARGGVALGYSAGCGKQGAIALGAYSSPSSTGEMNIGTTQTYYGYNSSNYRLISGVYDGQSAHDAATYGQLNGRIMQNAGAPTTSTVGTVGQLLEDTTNGKLYQCTDATNPYVWTEVGGGGGGGPNVVQTTGTSQTDVMSQNAVTSMVFADPGTNARVQIGNNASSNTECVAIGENAFTAGQNQIAIGRGSAVLNASARGCIALGDQTKITGSNKGVMSIGPATTSYGYNSSNYRLLTGLYDGQSDHDAVTLGQLNSRIISSLTSAPTTSTVGAVGALVATVESGTGHLYICTDDTGGTYTWQQLV